MTATPDPQTPPNQPTTPDPSDPTGELADETSDLPSCLVMVVAVVLALVTGWFMLNVVVGAVHDRFMPPERPLSTLDVTNCLHVPTDKDPFIVDCGDTGSEEAPQFSVQALVPSPADCYRVLESEAVLTVDRRVACLGPRDAEKPRSAAGVRAGLCRSDEHAILGWRQSCGPNSREAILVFRTTDHTTSPRDQCLARGANNVDLAVATRLTDLTTRPATELPETQIVCAAALEK